MKSSDKVYGALSRLEDQLVGDMTIRDGTTVQHMLKRIEYAHEAVRGILKMALVDEPHEDIRRTEYVVKLEKTLAAIEAWATECSAQGICGTAVRDIREIIDATEGGEENAMRLKPVQETDLTARLAEAERERDAEAARHGKTLLRAEAAEAEVARLRGILDLVDSVDDCGVMRPPHVVVDMIRDALAVEEE